MPATATRSFALILLVCGSLGATAQAAADSDRLALDAATQAWVDAFNARDADAMAALTTEDVVLLPPNADPVRGQEAVRAIWGRAVAGAKAKASVTVAETEIAGEYAWKSGSYVYTLPNGVVVERGKFLEIWKRTDAGWKIHRDMYSSNLPVRIPPPDPPPSQPRMDR